MRNEDTRAFTIRIPSHLAEQIDMRAKTNRRTRNAEINVLLENGIDQGVAADLEVIKKTSSQ